ncbi:tryptophan dimethylallyltransferase-domain-containing protein [Cladorrhinum sp. PSN332]|nr:tryptophan dimethylallyltransferase-domain-containing protein [Cladorrhinum sp. PSN332]
MLRANDLDWWWKTRSPHLELLGNTGYKIESRMEALVFLYKIITPHLDDFTPAEYSWKWGRGNEPPKIQYRVEAISPLAGSEFDPFNQAATKDMIDRLSSVTPNLDLRLFYHFWTRLIGPSSPASAPKDSQQSTVFLAFETSRNGDISVKAYFVPIASAECTAAKQISDVIRSSGCSNLHAIDNLESYLKSDPQGSTLDPIMLGIDCIKPSESRLKIYARTRFTSFNSLQELWNRTLGLSTETPIAEELLTCNNATAGALSYFDVSPKSAVPDVKVYIPVRHYAKSERQIAEGLTGFMTDRARGRWTEAYIDAVERLGAETGGIDNTLWVYTYVTAAYQGRELAVTSYLNPRAYHHARCHRVNNM